jgi:hypothetical protein
MSSGRKFFAGCIALCSCLLLITFIQTRQSPWFPATNSTAVLLLQYTQNLRTLESSLKLTVEAPKKIASVKGSHISQPAGLTPPSPEGASRAPLDPKDAAVGAVSATEGAGIRETLRPLFDAIQSSVIFVKGRTCNELHNFRSVRAEDVVEADSAFLEQAQTKLEPGPNAKPLKIDYVLTYVNPRAMPDTPFMKRYSERYRDWNELHWSLRSIFQNGQLCLNTINNSTGNDSDCLIGNIFLVVANKDHVPTWLKSALNLTAESTGIDTAEPSIPDKAAPPAPAIEQSSENGTVIASNQVCSKSPKMERRFRSFLSKRVKVIEHWQIFSVPEEAKLGNATKELLQVVNYLRQRQERPAETPLGTKNVSISTVEAYNSNAIDLVLHRIPGLSRHFISVNNDMLLGRKLKMKNLFKELVDTMLGGGSSSSKFSKLSRNGTAPRTTTAVFCPLVPMSYFTETMSTPLDWIELPKLPNEEIGQVELMKRHTVSLMVSFARYASKSLFSVRPLTSLHSHAAVIFQFAHVPMLYDRDFMNAMHQAEPFSGAVQHVLSNNLHGRGPLDIWVPMWYVNIRRIALLFTCDIAKKYPRTISRPKQFFGLSAFRGARLEELVRGTVFIGLGSGVLPFKTVLYRHVEYRFVMMSTEDDVGEQPYLLSRRQHDGRELFITFNDDFPGDLSRVDRINLQHFLFDDNCPSEIRCDMRHVGGRVNAVERAPQQNSRRYRRWSVVENNRGPDALRILMYFHKMFCTWERAWLGQPLEW